MQSYAAGVLTRIDIHKIRHYVQHKYADLPTERRAEIVADAMQRIVLRQLPEFPKEQQLSVVRTLLREVVTKRSMSVNDAQIFEACMKLDLERPELLQPLHTWTENRLGVVIAGPRFQEAVAEGSRIANAPELGLSAWDAVIGTVGLHQDESGLHERKLLQPADITLPNALRRGKRTGLYLAMSLVLSSAMLGYGWRLLHPAPVAIQQPALRLELPVAVHEPSIVQRKNDLPADLRYTEVDAKRLAHYLRDKSSVLAEEPYLSAIINAAKDHDIHPLLLFAITGQEQGFVPKTAKKAAQIANNPFNVFYSWKAFNTTIDESAKIAANTINRLSFERPDNVDAIQWINREYAEDVNWWSGVSSILKSMIAGIMTDKQR